MRLPNTVPLGTRNLTNGKGAKVSEELKAAARAEAASVLKDLGSRPEGLTQAEVVSRMKVSGPNEIAREKRRSPLMRLVDNVKNPLVILLSALGVLSFLTGDLEATVV